MRRLKTMIFSIAMFSLLSSFSQCSDERKLEDKVPLEFGDVYYRNLPRAIRDLPSVKTLYIPINTPNPNVELDSVYFKGRSAKLEVSEQNKKLYLARIVTQPEYSEDIIMSSDMAEEHQNKLPKMIQNIPFELRPNECIISYIQAGKTKYYKISNIKQKRFDDVPMVPRNNR